MARVKALRLVSKKILINDLEEEDSSWLINFTDGTRLRGGVNSGKKVQKLKNSFAITKEHKSERENLQESQSESFGLILVQCFTSVTGLSEHSLFTGALSLQWLPGCESLPSIHRQQFLLTSLQFRVLSAHWE